MNNTKTNVWSFAIANLKAKKSSFFAIAFLVASIIPVYAQQYDSEKDFKIDFNDRGGVKIIGYIGSKKEVNIPPIIQNNTVTAIGNNAFEKNNNITKVTIPNTVKTIGKEAFMKSEKLTTVIIPNGVTSIGESAFYYTGLTSITIPDSVTIIGEGAFASTNITSIIIPDSVSRIERSTFIYCNNLSSITIPDSVSRIENKAFAGCVKLTNVTIGKGVSIIGDEAFSGCTNLASIIIPNNVTRISDWAFRDCTNLTSVTLQGGTNIRRAVDPVFPGDLENKVNGGGPGVYKRFAGGNTWQRESRIDQIFPAAFIGIWKRDNFNNTLDLYIYEGSNSKASGLKSSSQEYTWSLISITGDSYLIYADNTYSTLSLKLVNGNIQISGDSGNGENNWNGTWKKIN